MNRHSESFTFAETEILFNALDALEHKDGKDFVLTSILGAVLSRDQDEAKRNMEEERIQFDQQQRNRHALKEQIVLLKAKIITMRNQAEINELCQ